MDFINMVGNGVGMALAVFIGLYVDSVGPRIIGLIGATFATLVLRALLIMPVSFRLQIRSAQ